MNNKVAIIIIFILCVIGFLLFGNNIYSPYSDIGRELYIPWQIAQGKVLYKDIFCIYPPMGYLINGFIVKIFGAKLFVFTIIGFVISLLSLIACYLISGKYTDKKTALILTFNPRLRLFSLNFKLDNALLVFNNIRTMCIFMEFLFSNKIP